MDYFESTFVQDACLEKCNVDFTKNGDSDVMILKEDCTCSSEHDGEVFSDIEKSCHKMNGEMCWFSS